MIRQISVFMENRAGRLNRLLNILSENGINICALSIADTGEYGIGRMIVENHEKAMAVLKENGFSACETEVIAVEFKDDCGKLYQITSLLADNNINVEYAYSAIPAELGRGIIILRVDNPKGANEVIAKVDFVNSLSQFKANM